MVKLAALTAAFAVLMLVLREHSAMHILITVAYIFMIVNVMYDAKLKIDKEECVE